MLLSGFNWGMSRDREQTQCHASMKMRSREGEAMLGPLQEEQRAWAWSDESRRYRQVQILMQH
jgi:hypothetical protein